MNTIQLKSKTIKFARARKGTPALWEMEKEFDSMKRTTLIFDEIGNQKEAIFSRIGKDSSLIPIREGDYIAKVFFDEEGVGISYLRIIDIDKYSNIAEVEVVCRKPSNSTVWSINENAKLIPDDVYDKIDVIVHTLIK